VTCNDGFWNKSFTCLDGVYLTPSLADWLLYSGSTTQRLKDLHGLGIKADVLPDVVLPVWLEARVVVEPDSWVRNSLLFVSNRAWMVASIVFPPALMKKHGSLILSHGSTPIGNLIFSEGNVKRSEMKYAAIDYRDIPSLSQLPITNYDFLIMRHSRVVWHGFYLDVAEVFLPHHVFD
jgi:chorismate-pyruvate lyase